VAEPIELLRAGVVFHARGLINARVIQHNLDWVSGHTVWTCPDLVERHSLCFSHCGLECDR